MICEFCQKIFEAKYKQQRFCNCSCSVAFNNRKRRLSSETKEKIRKTLKRKHSKNVFMLVCKCCETTFIAEYSTRVFCTKSCMLKFKRYGSKSYNSLEKLKCCISDISLYELYSQKKSIKAILDQFELVNTHLVLSEIKNRLSKYVSVFKNKSHYCDDNQIYFIDKILFDRTNSLNTFGKKYLRKAMLQVGFIEECAECGLTPLWNNKQLQLQIHHIDGNRYNDVIDNLCFLCPNCHSQTNNYCSRNTANCVSLSLPKKQK